MTCKARNNDDDISLSSSCSGSISCSTLTASCYSEDNNSFFSESAGSYDFEFDDSDCDDYAFLPNFKDWGTGGPAVSAGKNGAALLSEVAPQDHNHHHRPLIDDIAKASSVNIDGVDYDSAVNSSFDRVRRLLSDPQSNLNSVLGMFADEDIDDEFSEDSDTELSLSDAFKDLDMTENTTDAESNNSKAGGRLSNTDAQTDAETTIKTKTKTRAQAETQTHSHDNYDDDEESIGRPPVHHVNVFEREKVWSSGNQPQQQQRDVAFAPNRPVPRPQARTMRRRLSLTADGAPRQPRRENSKSKIVTNCVQFKSIHVRIYERVLGDNPPHSTGPSISIGWNYETQHPVSVDDWESQRCNERRKSSSQMIMTDSKRIYLARHFGFSQQEIAENAKLVRKLNRQRRRTVDLLTVEALTNGSTRI